MEKTKEIKEPITVLGIELPYNPNPGENREWVYHWCKEFPNGMEIRAEYHDIEEPWWQFKVWYDSILISEAQKDFHLTEKWLKSRVELYIKDYQRKLDATKEIQKVLNGE
jgi:uncharacterized protein YeaO (DUF488 family)